MIRPLLAALVLLAVSRPATAAAAERATRVILYTVTDPISGKLRPGYIVSSKTSGSCWTGSLSARRPDAWRCMVANEIHDPCFAPAMDTHVVYCPDYRNRKSVLAIALTKPLPVQYANQGTPTSSGIPTRLALSDGISCTFITGATGVVGGMRINYGCSDGRVLLGQVDRSSPRWRIYAMRRGGSSDVTLVEIETATY